MGNLSFFSVAYTAEEVQYNWLSGSEPVGLEGDLQMSQFDLQKTFARELNFTRHESGNRIKAKTKDWWDDNVFKLDLSPSCKLCFCSSGTQDTFLFRFVQNTRYNLPLINTSMHLLHDVTTCYWKLNLVVSGVSSLCSDCCPILGRILAQQRSNLRPCDAG